MGDLDCSRDGSERVAPVDNGLPGEKVVDGTCQSLDRVKGGTGEVGALDG